MMIINHNGRNIRAVIKSILGVASLFAVALSAYPAEETSTKLEEVVVTGYRASVEEALEAKRASIEMIDVIKAEDIAKFPDANLAESLQRLPGVSIDRDNGEGRTITVRGLGADFTTVRLNGMDALSTAGGNESGAAPNRSRGFDFNTFASDLFNTLQVQKTASAATEEGSLGAVVDLTTGRPLQYRAARLAFSAEAGYFQNGEKWSPRLSALASNTWFDNTVGLLVSASYNERDSVIDSWQRNPGVFDYVYRNSALAGITPATYGFALPGAAPAGKATGTYGSDPIAYAQLNNTALFPALGTLSHQDLSYTRLGTSTTFQWKPIDQLLITADYVYSKFHQENISYQLTTVGLNRNGTNAGAYNGTLSGDTAKRGVYARCDPSATVDCGQSIYGGSVVPGTFMSFNPHNLDPYDYYNKPVSPGFISDPNGIAFYNQLLGRPGSQVMGADVNAFNQVDYLALNNVDWRSAADGGENDTFFHQFSVNADIEFTDKLRATVLVGQSDSDFRSATFLTEFNAIDQDGFVYDERGGGNMPVFTPGFDVADKANWDLVKGLSAIRYFKRSVDNSFKTLRLEFTYDLTKQFALNFGGSIRDYTNSNSEARRNSNIEAVNPTLSEAHATIDQLGQMVSFGTGLSLPAGTPTSWYAPNMAAFRRYFGIDCDCVNGWADWRGSVDNRQANVIEESDRSVYLQASFDYVVFNRNLRGNVGVRYATTETHGSGVLGTLPLTGENKYSDTLPSFNLSYEVMPDLVARLAAAKVMSRPLLANLTPGSTSYTPTCTPTTTGPLTCSSLGSVPSVTMGNPYLNPFRANNYDVSLEWYFDKGAVLSAAYFRKDVGSFPQQLLGAGPMSTALQGDAYQQFLSSLYATSGTAGAIYNYTLNDGTWAIRQYKDSPGGRIDGVELAYQQNFTFLPWPFNGFGVQANYTHIDSELKYIVNGDTGAYQTAPWLNVSPDAFNATLYYENELWDARLSGAYRKEYIRQFPISTGTCEVGTTTLNGGPCNAPIMADFIGTDDSFNLDASFGINVGKVVKLTVEALNITNQTTNRWLFGANHMSQSYISSGRIVFLGMRAVF